MGFYQSGREARKYFERINRCQGSVTFPQIPDCQRNCQRLLSGCVSCEWKDEHVSTHDRLLMCFTRRGERDNLQDNKYLTLKKCKPRLFGLKSSETHAKQVSVCHKIYPELCRRESFIPHVCEHVYACSKCFALCELWPSEGNRRNIFPPEARVVSEMSVFLNNFNPGDRGQGILLWTNVL